MRLKIGTCTVFIFSFLSVLSVAAFAQHAYHNVPVDTSTVSPGDSVLMGGKEVKLYEGKLTLGESLKDLLKGTDVEIPFRDKVMIINIVPSIDTQVCGIQTYTLDTMSDLSPEVLVVTVSRDLPMAQKRWAEGHGVSPNSFVSDYKTGSFGKTTGLMMKDVELLARGVMVLDKKGIVRHFQIVSNVSRLPDLQMAVEIANRLVDEK